MMNRSDDCVPAARAALWCAAASSAAALVSIAASQILLGCAIVALLARRDRWRLPPASIALALFLAGTVLALAFSANPAAGLPQIKKFYVFLMLPVVYSAVREVRQAREFVLVWAAVASAASLRALVQFLLKVQEAHRAGQSLYEYYVGERITGFMSHWQTFGGEQMMVLLLLAAFLMFSPHARRWALWLGLAGAALLGMALLLGYTRGVWLATALAALYLVWCWRRRLLLLAPLVIVAVLWINPGAVRQRFVSGFEPNGQLDSNQFRVVCWRTGWQMIKAHPVLGLGPEVVRLQFDQWVPADVPRPLPVGWYGHLHNVYVHYAAERGIPTMLALVFALVWMLRDFLHALARLKPGPSDERFLLHGAFAVVAAIMVAGLFEVNLGDSEVLAMFLSTVALGYVARAKVVYA
ncbi:MAG TPA: O-antigen ligase family protein [Bryobacteraceae bacterium]|nr:O-antigen ligase family protein [Bryobacteraceae bacterium]